MSAVARNHLREGLKKHFTPEQLSRLASVRIGIAGAGGLGSNIAMLLARSGIEHMLIVDHDNVAPSNLNRQHFWPRHVGAPKIQALAESLHELNSEIQLTLLPYRLCEGNLAPILSQCPIWMEALDCAETKKIFVEKALLAGKEVFAASGLCGCGGTPMIVRRMGHLVVAGDFNTGLDCAPPLAPRVMQAAALMTDAALDFILRMP